MASEQDVWELIVKTIGAEKLEQLKAQLEGVTRASKELADESYELADVYEVVGQEQVDAFETAIQYAMAQAKVEEATEKNVKAQKNLVGAASESKKGMSVLQQQITAGSYALQDFTATSGDLGAKLNSVSNNIPQLLAGLGGLGTALSVAFTVGVAVYKNWDMISSLWEERNPFPKAADDVAGLKRELERAKDATEKLEKAGVGNAKQLEEYNRLASETARLEKDIADQTERQNVLKKLRGGVSEEQEGRAKGFAEATKGTDFEAKLKEAYQHDIDNEIEAARVGMALRIQAAEASGATDEERAKVVKEESAKYSEVVRRFRDPANDPAKLAEDLFVRLGRGEEQAGVALERLMSETGVTFGNLRARMEAANPVIKKQMDEAFKEIEEVARIEIEAAQKQKTAAEKALDADLHAILEDATKQQAAHKKADTEKERGVKVRQQLEIEANKPFLARETGVIKAGGMAEQAEATLAMAKGGKFGRMTPDQQFAFVQRQAAQQLKQQFPRMGAQQRDDMATRVTAMGQKGLEQRMVTLQAQGVNAVDRTQVAMQQALAAVQALANKANQQGARADRLGRGFQQVGNAMEQNQPGAQNVGGR